MLPGHYWSMRLEDPLADAPQHQPMDDAPRNQAYLAYRKGHDAVDCCFLESTTAGLVVHERFDSCHEAYGPSKHCHVATVADVRPGALGTRRGDRPPET